MIKLENIEVYFHDKHGQTVQAVDKVNLHISKGEIFGIVGYSGAGKSTLVRVINLLQKPQAGSVIINNQDLMALNDKQLRAARKKIGMIFQHFNLMNSRTVYGNVLYPLRDAKLSKAEKEQKIEQLLSLVGLADKRDVYPSQLSGGQKQRVAIARALANDPEILLCDEATSALDPKNTQAILKLLKEVNQKLGITMVLITHEMDVVKEICHKVAVMEKGRVIEAGNLVDIFCHPKHSLTQDFIYTASNVELAYQNIFDHPQLASKLQTNHLFELQYKGHNSFSPFISEINQRYQAKLTILYSNVEIIQAQPVGRLIVLLTSDSTPIEVIESYLQSQNIALSRLHALQHENYYSI